MDETRKGKQGRKRVWKVIFSILMVAMVGVVAYFFKAYSDIGSTAESIYNEVSVVEMREESIEVETATQPISFLLLGADTGTAEEERTETGRSDTIIVCTVNPNTKTTTLLSIPRDSYAEIVGYSDADGNSPFWDALGKHFFDLPYVEAERLCGLQSRRFLAELMPQYPIYVPMLPLAAQECIGRIHPDGQEAFDILQREGFETNSYIDLFDAGPTLYARTANIRSITHSQTAQVHSQPQIDARGRYLLSNDALHGYRAIVAELDYQPGQPLALTPALCAALNVSEGSPIRLIAL